VPEGALEVPQGQLQGHKHGLKHEGFFSAAPTWEDTKQMYSTSSLRWMVSQMVSGVRREGDFESKYMIIGVALLYHEVLSNP
jgi:hypothetical protein